MNKKQKIKEILQELIEHSKKNGHFSRYEIERAIKVTLYATDDRTIQNWFGLLWSLEIFSQPIQGAYDFCWDRIVELEVGVPVDVNQRRLTNV